MARLNFKKSRSQYEFSISQRKRENIIKTLKKYMCIFVVWPVFRVRMSDYGYGYDRVKFRNFLTKNGMDELIIVDECFKKGTFKKNH